MTGPLIDTDIFVDHLRGHRALPVIDGAAYSVLTRAELFAGARADEAVIDTVLSAFDEIGLDRAVAEEAGRLRRETGIELPDALIAATALLTSRSLFTNNVKHFSRVKKLRLYKAR